MREEPGARWHNSNPRLFLYAVAMVQTFSVPAHPYFPPDADVPHYIPNASSLNELLVRFASLLSITIFTALWLATRFNPHMRPSDKSIFGWFILCESSI